MEEIKPGKDSNESKIVRETVVRKVHVKKLADRVIECEGERYHSESKIQQEYKKGTDKLKRQHNEELDKQEIEFDKEKELLVKRNYDTRVLEAKAQRLARGLEEKVGAQDEELVTLKKSYVRERTNRKEERDILLEQYQKADNDLGAKIKQIATLDKSIGTLTKATTAKNDDLLRAKDQYETAQDELAAVKNNLKSLQHDLEELTTKHTTYIEQNENFKGLYEQEVKFNETYDVEPKEQDVPVLEKVVDAPAQDIVPTPEDRVEDNDLKDITIVEETTPTITIGVHIENLIDGNYSTLDEAKTNHNYLIKQGAIKGTTARDFTAISMRKLDGIRAHTAYTKLMGNKE